MTRALRVLMVASDGLSTGHLTRALALGTALDRRAAARALGLETLVATTSEADDLLRFCALPSVRLPSPRMARQAGWSDEARRSLATHTLLGIAAGMCPDLLVVDTFPSGPQLELTPLLDVVPRRVLVRRSVRDERALDPRSRFGLERYDLVLIPDDPGPLLVDRACNGVGPRTVRVPPITMFEPSSAHPRDEARRRLGLPLDRTLILVQCGGGGDPDAATLSSHIARTLLEIDPSVVPVIALGPLAVPPALPSSLSPSASSSSPTPVDGPLTGRTLTVRAVPLQPDLAAFDMAISAAGYNASHELAKARIPTALLARERLFDDQRGRAERFEKAGLAVMLEDTSRASVARALSRLRETIIQGNFLVETRGSDVAADAILSWMAGPAERPLDGATSCREPAATGTSGVDGTDGTDGADVMEGTAET